MQNEIQDSSRKTCVNAKRIKNVDDKGSRFPIVVPSILFLTLLDVSELNVRQITYEKQRDGERGEGTSRRIDCSIARYSCSTLWLWQTLNRDLHANGEIFRQRTFIKIYWNNRNTELHYSFRVVRAHTKSSTVTLSSIP